MLCEHNDGITLDDTLCHLNIKYRFYPQKVIRSHIF